MSASTFKFYLLDIVIRTVNVHVIYYVEDADLYLDKGRFSNLSSCRSDMSPYVMMPRLMHIVLCNFNKYGANVIARF